ncbi:hypothetical protein GCM10010193_53060 [Kitasatospora atroaurantiaca]
MMHDARGSLDKGRTVRERGNRGRLRDDFLGARTAGVIGRGVSHGGRRRRLGGAARRARPPVPPNGSAACAARSMELTRTNRRPAPASGSTRLLWCAAHSNKT